MMKATLSLLAAALFAPLSSDALTFNLTGDWLADEYASKGIPNGALIMLVASTKDKSFDAPDASGYIPSGSDDVILGTFSAIDGDGILNKGSYITSIQVNLNDTEAGFGALDGGDPLMLRWFPTLTEQDAVRPPQSGKIPYGEFRTDEIADGSTNPWITPGSNSATVNLNIKAAAQGSVYNPKGSIAVKQLAAANALSTAIIESTFATVSVSSLANGSISLSWPLLESGIGQVQHSADLLTWENLSMDSAKVGENTITLDAQPTGKSMFFRIASD